MPYTLTLNQIFTGASASPKNRWMACNFYDKVIFNCSTVSPLFWPGYGNAVPLPGLDPNERYDGVTVFAGHIVLWEENRMKYCDIDDYSTWIPVGESVSSVHCTLRLSAVQVAPNVPITLHLKENVEGLQPGQFIRIDYFLQTNFYQVVSSNTSTNTVVAILLNLTGSTPAGVSFPPGTPMDTLPANDAGELVNSGDRINGKILQIITLGDDAYIFKDRSIQMMQYTQVQYGYPATFVTQPLISDEGMLGRYSWCRSTDEIIYFLGNRELYAYAGGRDMRPVATQHTKQMYAELNRAEADRIVMTHYENQNEIWVIYPVSGLASVPRRVLIYNYRWDTCMIDDYDESTGAITAVGTWDWQVVVPWAAVVGSWAAQDQTWEEIEATNSLERLTVMALTPVSSSPTLNIYGKVYTRNAAPYQCLCETQDYDFGNSMAYKYCDTQFIALEVLQNLTPRPFRLYVQLGARDNLDSTIRWSSPQSLEVSGNGMRTTKTNIRASGRYIRARFYSNQANVQWKVSSFRLLARLGGQQ